MPIGYAPMVGVAGIEPATSPFQAEMSTSDLHAVGDPCENRTRFRGVKSRGPNQ